MLHAPHKRTGIRIIALEITSMGRRSIATVLMSDMSTFKVSKWFRECFDAALRVGTSILSLSCMNIANK